MLFKIEMFFRALILRRSIRKLDRLKARLFDV